MREQMVETNAGKVELSRLRNSILYTLEEYTDLVSMLTSGIKVELTEEGNLLHIVTNSNTLWSGICEELSDFFGVEVINIHVDNDNPKKVWISYQ